MNMSSTKRYLLLGGAGFIGTHLAKKLISDGHDVTIVDSCVTSSPPNYEVNFILADLLQYDIDELVRECDIVYFLAGSVGVQHIVDNPKSTLQNNIGLMARLIPIFEKHNKPVVFSSTSEVYGEGPFSEDNHLSIGPPSDLRWTYASAKLSTEFMIAASSFPYTIVRFFNVSGPGQLGDYGMVLPRFVNAAKRNEPLVVYSSGEQVRSFCHVTDAVNLLQIVENIHGQIFNIGSNDPIRMFRLAEKVIRICNSASTIKFIPTPHSDIIYRVPDLSKLIKHTNYSPRYTLDDIIKDMI